MKKTYDAALERVLADKKLKTIASIIALGLCLAAIPLIILFSLRTAVTEERRLICAIEEHIHLDECFDLVLVCEQPETEESAAHSHDETCFEQIDSLVCDPVETHVHAEDCYEFAYAYDCGLDESETDHIHTENCLSERAVLICGQDEHLLHSHTEECYIEEFALICIQEESLPHRHTEECYYGKLICEQEEHTHTEDCDLQEYYCGLEEDGTGHIHTEECYLRENVSEPDGLLQTENDDLTGNAALATELAGEGSHVDPYIITSAAELQWLAEAINEGDSNYKAGVYKLGADIDLSEFNASNAAFNADKGWIPIGTETNPFSGTFDGNGKKITGLYINRNRPDAVDNDYPYSALFGYVYGGTIKNLGLIDVNVNGNIIAAGVAASLANGGTVESCYVTGSITGYEVAGGIVGVLNNGDSGINTIDKCYTTASVTAENFWAGGIVGSCVGAAMISNCYSTGEINNIVAADGQTSQAGGILGNVDTDASVTIENCYSTGKIFAKDVAGGIVSGAGIGLCSVINSTALNLGVSGNAVSNRISGGTNSVTFLNNRAYHKMQDKDGGITWDQVGTQENENGLGMTADDAITASFWSESMKWDGTSIWDLEDGKLPILTGLDGQSGMPHFEEDSGLLRMNRFVSEEIATARIHCEKTILGSDAPGGKEFRFKLTEVDENGTPVIPLFEMEMAINGAGRFWFDVPIYEIGTHYYRITEEAGIRDGWNYDSNIHIVEVHVADDANHTVTTSLDGSSESYYKVTFGSPTTIHAKPGKPFAFNIIPNKKYRYTGNGYAQFIISDETRKYIGLCADSGYLFPDTIGQYYELEVDGDKSETPTALAAALSVLETENYQNGTGLTEDEYISLLGINRTYFDDRKDDMQKVVWHYVNNRPILEYHQSLRNTIQAMIDASKNTPEGQSITSLSLEYNENTGQLTFTHEGFQPPNYNTWLTWTGDTNGLTVNVNGKIVSTNTRVKITDKIMITYTGVGAVEFFLTDHELYLKAGSVKGYLLKNVSNASIQPCLVGSAEFVKIQNSFKIAWCTASTEPDGLDFVNEFRALPTVSAGIIGNKTITGIGAPNEVFTFRLTQVTDVGGATPVSPLYTDSDTVTGAGTFRFNIQGLYSGVYFYKIEEDANASTVGWTYDNLPRVVQVDVSEDAVPVVSITYPQDGLTFNNFYQRPDGASAVIDGKKQIDGIDTTSQVFAFSLIQVADITGDVPFSEDTAHMDSVITNGAGTFRFELEDLFPGVYYYKITEVADESDNGWDYDRSVYIVVVTVTNVGLSDYNVAISYQKDGTPVNNMLFTNTFVPPPSTEAIIRGVKQIAGISSTDQEFKFILERVMDESGSELFLPNYDKETVTIGAGEFSFTIPELLPGDYYFKIIEDSSEPVERWRYDQTIHVVMVTITEELEVTVRYPGESDAVQFTNNYYSADLLPKTGAIGTKPLSAAVVILTALLSVFLSGALIYKRNARKKLINDIDRDL